MAKNDIQHILVIRLSAMGDVAMIVPVLLALTKQYPQLRLTVLTRGFFSPMFNAIPNVEVFEVQVKGKHKGFLGLWHLYSELKLLNIDAVADLHNVLRSKILKFFFSATGIPFFQIDKGRKEKKALTRVKNKIFKPLKTTHARYADVFGALGFPLDLSGATLLPKTELSPQIVKVTGPKTRKWLGIAPFAAFAGKQYPLELIRDVMARLSNTKKYKIVLFGGGKKEVQLLGTLASTSDEYINMAGKLSFDDELSLISNLDAMLSMDSGNGHLAAMFGIPVITLWGITHPYSGFAPFGQSDENFLMADRNQFPAIPTSVYGNKCPKGYEKAIATIPPRDIVRKIERLIF